MQTCHVVRECRVRLPIQAALPLRSGANRKFNSTVCSGPVQRSSEGCQFEPNHLLTLAATVAPLLFPLQAFSEDQISIADAGIPNYEIVSIATAALPAVAFGAATLIQQAKQAREDKALRMKAIRKHNTFLSTQEEDDAAQDAVASAPVTNSILRSSGAPSQSSASSSEEPDTAAPAMLDQPERPEPQMPSQDEETATSSTPDTDKQSTLPPQTAMLDRPDRPEPESSHDGAADAKSSSAQQKTAFTSNTAGDSKVLRPSSPARPGSPATREEAVAWDAEYQAKMRNLKGSRLSTPARHPSQEVDMAAQYASKLAALHEESAARAEADLRKRQHRHELLADLQAQAQMECPSTEQLQSRPSVISQAQTLLIAIVAFLLRPLRWLVTLARKVMGVQQKPQEQSATLQYQP